MPNRTENLDRESLLLLYLNDELSAPDRSGVERLLAKEPAAAQELQRLQALQQAAFDALANVDDQRSLPLSQEAAVRRFARDAAQWQVDRLSRPQPEPQGRSHWRPWTYGLGGVAAVILIAGFLYYRLARIEDQQFAVDPSTSSAMSDADQQGSTTDPSTQIADDPDAAASALALTLEPNAAEERDRLAAQRQLEALSLLSDAVR